MVVRTLHSSLRVLPLPRLLMALFRLWMTAARAALAVIQAQALAAQALAAALVAQALAALTPAETKKEAATTSRN